MPAPATAGDEAEELGLAVPQFQDVELAPCVFRRTASRAELLVSAAAVKELVGTLEFDSARVLFATAAGVLVDGDLLAIEGSEALELTGAAIAYRVKLRAH